MLVFAYTLAAGVPLTDFWTLACLGELLLIDNAIVCYFLFGGKKPYVS